MKRLFIYSLFLAAVSFASSCKTKTEEVKETPLAISDDSLMTLVQYQTFQYFWDNAEPVSGLGRERTHMDNNYPANDKHIVTTGGSGFGLMAILVGIERKFITREQAVERFTHIVNFLDTADRFHGVWPHWLNGETGKVKPFSPKDDGGDLVETAYLVQGLIAVREYFKDGNDAEKALASKIDKLWREVEWDWYTNKKDVLYWHWSPNNQWAMNFPIGGYNECLITYVLAAASPTHSIKPEVYHKGWARNDSIKSTRVFYDLETVLDHYESNDNPVGPLFWAHYSYLGLDPRNLKDRYADYWALNQNHALIIYKYCVDNPKHFEGYGPTCWGLTSSYSIKGYAGHNPSEDLGVISPTAALSSFPYTPKESMQMLKFLYAPVRDSLVGPYGPYDAFSFSSHWLLPHYLAIDQGPIPVMIENHRTGLLWKLFMNAPEVKSGLDKLGFTY
ncbi:MAG TPA: glucoamylase family protein [Cyclobacteriaceae bacterium]|nr:glucoamylase family protein [Cyclobacteriaceae bacterium]